MSTDVFYQNYSSVALSSFATGAHAGFDSHYMILMDETHAYIMYDARNKTRRRFSEVLSNSSIDMLNKFFD